MAESTKPNSFLELIRQIDSLPYNYTFPAHYRLLLPHDARTHGFITPSTVSLMPWSSEFIIDHDALTVQLTDSSNGENTGVACSAAFRKTIDAAIAAAAFPILAQGHSEPYRILGTECLITLERFAAPLFGVAARGAHMTAYIRSSSGEIKFWVPRRSRHLGTFPGMLDSSVAGGVKAEESPLECIVHEADEEASLDVEFVREHARAVGTVTHMFRSQRTGLVPPTVLYVFDIELPETMIPAPKDDEVEEFMLMGVEEVRQAMLGKEIKPNSVLVYMDFFVRHGLVAGESEEGYAEICGRLRRWLPVPTTPM